MFRCVAPRVSAIFVSLIPFVPSAGVVHAGGFDAAVARANARVVKLYGLGAGRQVGYGTGIVVSPDGFVVTVFSLLVDAREILAVLPDGTRCAAAVVARDPVRQLTLLRLTPGADKDGVPEAQARPDPPEPMPSLDFFDLNEAATLRPGDWIIAAGNAFKVADGAEPMSVAHGVFSIRTPLDARRRLKDFPYRGDVLVIDAITSNPGGPGSVVVNLDGELVGMIGRVVTSNLTHTNFNYAVPRDVLLGFYHEATAADREGRQLVRGPAGDNVQAVDLGIRIGRTGYRKILPYVARVRRDSPAERAGVQKDDLILSINGRNVADADDYDVVMGSAAPGRPVDLVVRRGRRIINVRVETEGP